MQSIPALDIRVGIPVRTFHGVFILDLVGIEIASRIVHHGLVESDFPAFRLKYLGKRFYAVLECFLMYNRCTVSVLLDGWFAILADDDRKMPRYNLYGVIQRTKNSVFPRLNAAGLPRLNAAGLPRHNAAGLP